MVPNLMDASLSSFVSPESHPGFLSYVHSLGILFRFSLVCPFPGILFRFSLVCPFPRHFMPTKKRRGHPHRFPFLVVPRDYIPLSYLISCPVRVYSFSPRRMKIWPLRTTFVHCTLFPCTSSTPVASPSLVVVKLPE